jgi:tetratricopeptide (TPR) repeat protein
MCALQTDEPEPVTGLRTGVPPELERIIGKCLAKVTGERCQTAAGLLSDLVPLQNGLEQGESGRSLTTGVRARHGWRWPQAVAVGLAAVAVVILAWMLLRPGGGDRGDNEKALAIVDFRDMAATPDPVATAMLTELLSTALIEASPVRIQSPEYLRDIRRRVFGAADAPVAEGQELEIARAGAATYLLTGRLGVLESERFVTWRLVDVGSGRSLRAGRAEPGKLSAMVDGIVAGVLAAFTEATGTAPAAAQVPVEQVTSASAAAYEHYVLGHLRYAENRPEAALREFKRAVAKDSTFALAYLAMARLYFGTKTVVVDIALARRYAGAAWRHEDRLGIRDRLHLKAFQHGLDYEVPLELATYREILGRWPDSRETLRILETKTYWWWEFGQTVETARRGLEIYPDDQEIGGSQYTEALRDLGRYEDSWRVARWNVSRFPGNPNAWDELASGYLSLGQPDSARMAYERAFAIDPNWYPWSFAFCAYHAGDLDSAIAICEALLADEDLPPGRRLQVMFQFTHALLLPALYFEAGRHRDAVRIIEAARRLVGDDPSFWQYEAGTVLMAVGLPDRALEIAAAMERSDEIRARIFVLRFKGLAQVAAGDLAAARATAVRTHERAETAGAFIGYCGYQIEAAIALAEGDPTAALAALAKLSEIGVLFGGMVHIEDRTMLARAHRMAGHLEDAAAVHRELLHIYGGHALSHFELGEIYAEMGRPDEAEREYVVFLEMWSEADEGLPQLLDARARLAALRAGTP